MRFSTTQAVLWLVGYVILAAAPVFIAYAGPLPPVRDAVVEFAVGLGFVGLAMLALQFVLTGRFQQVAESAGLDSMLHFHRQMGIAAFLFILAHPVLLFISNPAYLIFLDPRVNLPRAVALSMAMAALVLLIASTLWRKRFGLTYEYWRFGHGILAAFVLFVGLVHVIQVGYYIDQLWKQVLWAVLTVAALGLLLHARLFRPLHMMRHPYRVMEVRRERGPSYTVFVEPVGHPGMRFTPGQFAWVTIGRSPFSMQQHPFSFSTSAERPQRIGFTIKELGDFTSTIKNIEPGTAAYLEGPFGAFTPPPQPGRGVVFIVGGVGITPVMSMLRTFRDRHERRTLHLIYGNLELQTGLFVDELAELEKELDLRVVHVIEKETDDWRGEVGRIDPDLLDRLLPENPDGFDYLVCGPEPMMDVVERYLRKRGLPIGRILSERFQIV